MLTFFKILAVGLCNKFAATHCVISKVMLKTRVACFFDSQCSVTTSKTSDLLRYQ